MKLCENTQLADEIASYENLLENYGDVVKYIGFSVLQVKLDDEQLSTLEIPEPNPNSEDDNVITVLRRSPGVYSLGLFEKAANQRTRMSYTTWSAANVEVIAKNEQGITTSPDSKDVARLEAAHLYIAKAVFQSPYPELRLEKVRQARTDINEQLKDPKITISAEKELSKRLKQTVAK